MSETEKRHCKVCRELKLRVLQGKFPNGRDKKWADETGLLWNGSKCPQCTVQHVREAIRMRRANAK